MKLNSEQREELDSLTQHYGWPVLLDVLQQLCAKIGNDVLQYNLEAGPDGLVAKKAQYEGARKLHTELLATVSKLNVRHAKKVNS